ncbi:unnamed protein product [Caenorhabditis brenneri]
MTRECSGTTTGDLGWPGGVNGRSGRTGRASRDQRRLLESSDGQRSSMISGMAIADPKCSPDIWNDQWRPRMVTQRPGITTGDQGFPLEIRDIHQSPGKAKSQSGPNLQDGLPYNYRSSV